MWTLSLFLSLVGTGLAIQCPAVPDIQATLGQQLSNGSSVGGPASSPSRWSDFGAPDPQIVVTVASEQDVATTVSASPDSGRISTDI